MPSAVHHLDGGGSPYRNRNLLSMECKHSKPSIFYSCIAHFSTKIVPQGKNKLANAHFTRLCELLKIIQTPRRETYYPCEGLISRAFNGDYSAFYHNYFMFSKI